MQRTSKTGLDHNTTTEPRQTGPTNTLHVDSQLGKTIPSLRPNLDQRPDEMQVWFWCDLKNILMSWFTGFRKCMLASGAPGIL